MLSALGRTCDLDGGVSFVVKVDSVRTSFLWRFVGASCFGSPSCGLGSILVGVCVMVWRIASVGSLLQGCTGVAGDVCMGETFQDARISFQQCEVTVGNFLQSCFLEFPERGVDDCQVRHPRALRYWTKVLRLRTDEVKVMICVSGQGTSWVLNSVGPVKRSDKRKVYQVAGIGM